MRRQGAPFIVARARTPKHHRSICVASYRD